MVGVGGSSPLGRTIHLMYPIFLSRSRTRLKFSYSYVVLLSKRLIFHFLMLYFSKSFSAVAQQLADFTDMNMFIFHSFQINLSKNHFLIHFTEISLYNTLLSLVEWFQPINLPNPEKIADD